MVFYGCAAGFAIPPVNVVDLIDMRTVTGFSLNAILLGQPEVAAVGLRDLIEMVTSGRVTPIVRTRLGLADAAKAHQLMEARAHLGKIVLIP